MALLAGKPSQALSPHYVNRKAVPEYFIFKKWYDLKASLDKKLVNDIVSRLFFFLEWLYLLHLAVFMERSESQIKADR